MDIKTNSPVELVDITTGVEDKVRESGIRNGICAVSTRHTTTSIIINENESGLRSDIQNMLEKLVPPSQGYMHDRIDNNADAHLRSILMGPGVTVPVMDGRLVLGTWQRIFFVELDGPRKRNVNIMVVKQE